MPQFDKNFKGPLAGMTVLDLSRLVAGNMVSLQLADYGAEVIKIEPAAKGDPLRHWVTGGLSISWKVYGRNKKSVSLDLRQDKAKDILLRLVEQADVMIENYRPGTLEEMGLGPDVLHTRNPDLILVRVSGFGLLANLGYGFPGWIVLKLVCWLGLAGMAGMAYRMPEKAGVLTSVTIALLLIALYAAYFKPFSG